MPWRCPACQLPIAHTELEPKPRRGAVYRCHICRLELTLDPDTDKLIAVPTVAADNAQDQSLR
jgi:hypothetical protein